MTDFRAVAASYAENGITVCPLGLDQAGKPKQRLDPRSTRFRPRDNTSHAWEHDLVKGIAIVLGPPSGGLAVIDIDARGMADFVWHWLSASDRPPLMCRTPRGVHIYCREPEPSRWNHLTAKYQGREYDVDILCAGNVSAVPPTPGYKWLDNKGLARPAYGNVLDIWREISIHAPHGIPYVFRRARSGGGSRSPSPSTSQIREALRDVRG
jgi:Bifunctional DNA primase/polymerase, N-terminal